MCHEFLEHHYSFKKHVWKCNHTCCDFNIGFITSTKVTREYEGWDNVFWFTHIPAEVWECNGGQSQTLPSENHIGSWNPIMLNEYMGQNKPCPNWAFIVMVERSWSMNIKKDLPFEDLKVQVMVKQMVGSQTIKSLK